MAKRNPFWDNTKFLLIIFVVLGHFADYVSSFRLASAAVLFIYSFHMPMFFFVSGLFLKYNKTHKFRFDKVLYFIIIGYAMKAAIYFMEKIPGGDPEWHWLSENNVPWYMFVMAGYLTIAYFIKSIPAKIVFPVSVVISLIVGYCNFIGNFLCLSRLIVFFPFFFVGFRLDPDRAQCFLKSKLIKIIGISSLIILAVCFILFNDFLSPILRPVFYSRFSYSDMPFPKYGIVLRICQYVIATLAIFGIGAVVPQKHIMFVSNSGTRTLAVYSIHYFLLRVFVAANINNILTQNLSNLGVIIWLVIAVMVSCVLSIKTIYYPFKFSQKLIYNFVNKLNALKRKMF